MMNRNRTELAGRLVSDVTLRDLPSGSKVASFAIATTRIYYDKDKNKREDVVFVDCEMFGSRAEHLAQYGSKGRSIFTEGRLRQDKWEDKDGNKRQKMINVVEDFDFLDFKETANGENKPQEDNKPAASTRGRATGQRGKPQPAKEEDPPF